MPQLCQHSIPSPPARPGFSRVDLVVVLFIVALAGGLFMIFLPRFREQANRRQCENNLRQIGTAIHVFRDRAAPPSLPAARIADHYATWTVQIAPFLGGRQAEPLRAWDLTKPFADQAEDVRQAQLREYYCPSRRLPGQSSISGDFAGNNPANGRHFAGALSDYACAAGDGDPRFPWTGAKANGTMILGEVLERAPDGSIARWRGRTDFALEQEGDRSTSVHVRKATGKPGEIRKQLERGTSQTALVGEKHVQPEDFGKAEQGDGSAYNGGRPASFSRIAGNGHGLAKSIYDPADLAYPRFGSYHIDVCHFLMADGSVRPIEVKVSGEVLGRMVVREEE